MAYSNRATSKIKSRLTQSLWETNLLESFQSLISRVMGLLRQSKALKLTSLHLLDHLIQAVQIKVILHNKALKTY